MAFIQKDKLSRKDKIERNNTGEGPEPENANGLPRVIIHREEDGGSHIHMVWPNEGRNSSPHLDSVLARLEEKAKAEAEKETADH